MILFIKYLVSYVICLKLSFFDMIFNSRNCCYFSGTCLIDIMNQCSKSLHVNNFEE